MTPRSTIWCSNQLSYVGVTNFCGQNILNVGRRSNAFHLLMIDADETHLSICVITRVNQHQLFLLVPVHEPWQLSKEMRTRPHPAKEIVEIDELIRCMSILIRQTKA